VAGLLSRRLRRRRGLNNRKDNMAFDNTKNIRRVDDSNYLIDGVPTVATAEESTIQAGRYLYYLTDGGENRVYAYHILDNAQRLIIEAV